MIEQKECAGQQGWRLAMTTAANNHKHLVYIRPGGQAVVSQEVTHANAAHAHDVIWREDEDGALVWDLAPGEDGHTHGIVQIQVPKTGAAKANAKAAQDVIRLYRKAREQERLAREKATEAEAFYCGEQWDEPAKGRLESARRAALTINEIESKIDLLSGHQRQRRSDWRFMPVEDGDQRIADVLNILVKNIADQTSFSHEEARVFQDLCITGRGLFNIYVDHDKDIMGKITIERFPWDACFFGPHEKMDLADCEYLIKTRWYSRAKLEQIWPDKAAEIQHSMAELERSEGISNPRDPLSPHARVPGSQYDQAQASNTADAGAISADGDLVNIFDQGVLRARMLAQGVPQGLCACA